MQTMTPAVTHLPPKHDSVVQRHTLPRNWVAPGAQQRVQNREAAIVQCFVTLGSWSCAPQKDSIFPADGRTSKNEVFSSWKSKATAKLQNQTFSAACLSNQMTSYQEKCAGIGCSKTSEKFQNT